MILNKVLSKHWLNVEKISLQRFNGTIHDIVCNRVWHRFIDIEKSDNR